MEDERRGWRARAVLGLLIGVWFLAHPFPEIRLEPHTDPAVAAWLDQVDEAHRGLRAAVGTSALVVGGGWLVASVYAWRGRYMPMALASLGVWVHAGLTWLLPSRAFERASAASLDLAEPHHEAVVAAFRAMGAAAGEATYQVELWSIWSVVFLVLALVSLGSR